MEYTEYSDAQSLPLRKESVDTVIAISILEHLRDPEIALTEFKRVLVTEGGLIVQIPNPEYFIEIHTKFPFIFLLPESIRDKINVRTFGYYYTNFRLSKKKLIQLLTPLFVLREAKPVYHRLKTPPWPPSWIMFMRARRAP
jgi:ubiquinone/menaquinone biosynthesis C-methylase UbiE